MTPLPIQPDPRPGEALATYLERVAEVNLQRPAALGWIPRDATLRHGHIDWATLSARTGLPVEDLRDLTPFRYPQAVIGNDRPQQRRRVWRVPEQQRSCPSCATHGRQRDWDLALTVCCLTCRQLLRPAASTATYPEIPDGDDLLTVQADINRTLAASANETARGRIGRLHRFARLVNLTAEATWPSVTSAYLHHLRAEHGWTPMRWTATTTPRDTAQIALLVAACWPHTDSRPAQLAFLAPAWDRLTTHGVTLNPTSRRSLPRTANRPERRVATPVPFAKSDAGGYPDAIQATAAGLAAAGVAPRHVPLLLTEGEEFLPPPHELARRHHLARSLIAALGEATGEPELDLPPHRSFRLGPHRQHHATPTRRELDTYTSALTAETVIDYDERRALLASLTRPAEPVPGPRELATAWIWVALTRSPLLTGIHRIRQVDLRTYHRNLDPEQRLALHDLGLRHLASLPDLTTETTTSPEEAMLETGQQRVVEAS